MYATLARLTASARCPAAVAYPAAASRTHSIRTGQRVSRRLAARGAYDSSDPSGSASTFPTSDGEPIVRGSASPRSRRVAAQGAPLLLARAAPDALEL